jgi:hypothetical protein
MRTDTPTLIKAMRILAQDIQSGDGVANAAIAEAADRLEEMERYIFLNETFTYHKVDDDIPTDGQYLMFWPEYGWCRALYDHVLFSGQGFWRIEAYKNGGPIDEIEYRWFLENPPTHWAEMPKDPV